MNIIITMLFATLFAAMGMIACYDPDIIARLFYTQPSTIDLRNEIRAVYGGYGLITAILLIISLLEKPGIVMIRLVIGLHLVGMAFTRIISTFIDGVPGAYPQILLLIQIIAGLLLLLTIAPNPNGPMITGKNQA